MVYDKRKIGNNFAIIRLKNGQIALVATVKKTVDTIR